MDVYGKSDIGTVRSTNQDDIKYRKIDDQILWVVVCDGMGGVSGGEIASSIAVDEISKEFDDKLQTSNPETDIKSMMILAISNANRKIRKAAEENSEYKNMGTTVVALVLEGRTAHVVSLGDSRAYIINNSGINQITVDHSVVQELVDKGEITKTEAASYPQKNIITKALGTNPDAEPDYMNYHLRSGESILMCTDGLTNELSDEEIHSIVISNIPCEIPDKLIEEANNRRGADNITAALII